VAGVTLIGAGIEVNFEPPIKAMTVLLVAVQFDQFISERQDSFCESMSGKMLLLQVSGRTMIQWAVTRQFLK
jgi:hypothetical protein